MLIFFLSDGVCLRLLLRTTCSCTAQHEGSRISPMPSATRFQSTVLTTAPTRKLHPFIYRAAENNHHTSTDRETRTDLILPSFCLHNFSQSINYTYLPTSSTPLFVRLFTLLLSVYHITFCLSPPISTPRTYWLDDTDDEDPDYRIEIRKVEHLVTKRTSQPRSNEINEFLHSLEFSAAPHVAVANFKVRAHYFVGFRVRLAQ